MTSQSWRFVDVALIAIASTGLMILGVLALTVAQVDKTILTLGATALEVVALIGCIYLFGLRRRHLSLQAVGLRPASGSWIAVAIGAGFACLFLTGLIALLVQALLGQKPQNPQLPFLIPGGANGFSAGLMFLLAGLAVPLAEEMFFRGILYTWLRERWGVWVGTLGSAIIFGAVHGELSIAVGIAFMGVIQAVVYERSRSLWTTFLIHAMNNGIKLLLLYALLASGISLTQ